MDNNLNATPRVFSMQPETECYGTWRCGRSTWLLNQAQLRLIITSPLLPIGLCPRSKIIDQGFSLGSGSLPSSRSESRSTLSHPGHPDKVAFRFACCPPCLSFSSFCSCQLSLISIPRPKLPSAPHEYASVSGPSSDYLRPARPRLAMILHRIVAVVQRSSTKYCPFRYGRLSHLQPSCCWTSMSPSSPSRV
jgi:hypothetical protein